jgi:hypothetical protein
MCTRPPAFVVLRQAVMLALAASLTAAGAGAQGPSKPDATPVRLKADTTYEAPRTPWGHPDLQGTYSNDDETGTPMERPRELEGRTLADITPADLQRIVKERNDRFVSGVSGEEFAGGLRPPAHLIFDTFDRRNSRAWLVIDPPDGRSPRRADAAPRRRTGGVSTNANPNGPFNSWLDMGLYDRCITRGIPASMMPAGYGSRYDITQAPDAVVIRYEMIHEARVIPLDGRARAGAALPQYLGQPRGWWDGDTLVVETINFLPETAPQAATGQVRMVERFRATSPGVVEWTATFEDPAVFTRPWTFSMPLVKVDHTQQLHEYACHEGNLAMRNILSAARAAEK